MSTIAGVVSLSDSPAQVADSFNLVFQSLAHRAGTPERWQNHQCAFGTRVPHGACDGLEKSHAAHPPTGCAIVFDGRLDNRDELISQLPELPAQPCDAEVVLHAYLHWAEDCAAKLLGDFAFAVWDPRSRSLYAARDPLGVRPFFYTVNSDRLGFACEFKALLSLPGVTRTPDDYMVSEFLLWWSGFPEMNHTFFRDIRRLPPAHWLRWGAKGVELHRYWAVDARRRIRYKQHQQYVEEFESLLTQAVAARLRGCRKIGIFLSGGMDSSAVAELAGRCATAPGTLYAFSGQIPHANDESGLAEKVAHRAGIAFRRHPIPVADFIVGFEAYVRQQAMPFVDLASFNDLAMLRLAAADGCSAILTGDGSDELFNFPWAYVADMVRKFRIRKLFRELGPYSRYNSREPLEMLGFASRYLVPIPMLRAWKFAKWRKAPVWVNPDFARRTELVKRLRWIRPTLPFDSVSANEDHNGLTRGRRILVEERRDVEAAPMGMHYRYPFYDRRLLEFMLAVPWDQKVTDGRVKSFLREADGLLPPEITALREKANYNPFSAMQMGAQDWRSLEPLFVSPPPQAAQYVDLAVARQVSRDFVHHEDQRHLMTFCGLAGFFLWLKNN